MTGDKEKRAGNRELRLGRKPKGFTMIEVLVTLAVFSTIVVAVTDIYLLSARAERKIQGKERLAGEARLALESMVRIIRNGSIAYEIMPTPLAKPLDALAVKGPDGTLYNFSKSGDSLLVQKGAEAAPLTSPGIVLENLKFVVAPDVDPYIFDLEAGDYQASEQPRVTIILVLSGENGQSISTQTSVSTRQYVR